MQCSDMTLVVPSSLIQSAVCLQAGGSMRPVPVPGHDVSRPVFSHTVYCMFAGRGAGTPVSVLGHDVSRPVFSHTVSCMFAGRRVCEASTSART